MIFVLVIVIHSRTIHRIIRHRVVSVITTVVELDTFCLICYP